MKKAFPVFLSLALGPALCASFTLKDTPGVHLDILENGKTVGRYEYAHDVSSKTTRTETYKPYLHLFAADGTTLMTKGSGGEFPHHRGIFIGWNQIKIDGKTFDRWHMSGGDQIHVRFAKQEAGEESATVSAVIQWDGAKPGAPIIEELRTYVFRHAKAPAHADVEVTSMLKALAGETSLGGDPEHAGIHFRPAKEIDRNLTTYLYPVAKAQPHKDQDYPWVACSFDVGGQKHQVVLLNHAGNPAGSRFSAYRDYGRFGVMPKAVVAKDATLTLRHRFVAATGEALSPEAIHGLSDSFNGKTTPAPATTVLPAEKAKPAAPKPPAPPASK